MWCITWCSRGCRIAANHQTYLLSDWKTSSVSFTRQIMGQSRWWHGLSQERNVCSEKEQKEWKGFPIRASCEESSSSSNATSQLTGKSTNGDEESHRTYRKYRSVKKKGKEGVNDVAYRCEHTRECYTMDWKEANACCTRYYALSLSVTSVIVGRSCELL